MKKYYHDIFLLSVFFLTAVFLSKASNIKIQASEVQRESEEEKAPEVSISKLKQLKEGGLSFLLEKRGFDEEASFQLRFYLKEHESKSSYKKIYEETIEGKETQNIRVPFEPDSSGFYTWKIRLFQGEKKAVLEGKEPIYLKGSFVKGEVIVPEAYFIDDVASISWRTNTNGSYWVGIYNKKNFKLVSELWTDEKKAEFELSNDIKEYAVAVARSLKGKKGNFKLIDFPNRELPNTMVRFEQQSVLNRTETVVDVIYTGNCFLTMEIGDKFFLKNSKEQGRFQLKLPEGEVKLKVSVKSDNGNIKTFTKKFLVDTIFPKITLNSEIHGAVTGDDHIVISGVCDEEVELLLNDGPLELNDKKEFSIKFTLNEGDNPVRLSAKDRAGNITNLWAVVKREIKHKPDIRIVILVLGTFGLIFLAYFVTFIGWLRVRKKRKS